jgi:hypothetical protein
MMFSRFAMGGDSTTIERLFNKVRILRKWVTIREELRDNLDIFESSVKRQRDFSTLDG